jgi:hypothetical protein
MHHDSEMLDVRTLDDNNKQDMSVQNGEHGALHLPELHAHDEDVVLQNAEDIHVVHTQNSPQAQQGCDIHSRKCVLHSDTSAKPFDVKEELSFMHADGQQSRCVSEEVSSRIPPSNVFFQTQSQEGQESVALHETNTDHQRADLIMCGASRDEICVNSLGHGANSRKLMHTISMSNRSICTEASHEDETRIQELLTVSKNAAVHHTDTHDVVNDSLQHKPHALITHGNSNDAVHTGDDRRASAPTCEYVFMSVRPPSLFFGAKSHGGIKARSPTLSGWTCKTKNSGTSTSASFESSNTQAPECQSTSRSVSSSKGSCTFLSPVISHDMQTEALTGRQSAQATTRSSNTDCQTPADTTNVNSEKSPDSLESSCPHASNCRVEALSIHRAHLWKEVDTDKAQVQEKRDEGSKGWNAEMAGSCVSIFSDGLTVRFAKVSTLPCVILNGTVQ